MHEKATLYPVLLVSNDWGNALPPLTLVRPPLTPNITINCALAEIVVAREAAPVWLQKPRRRL